MLCYHCQKVQECPIFRNLYTRSADFSINDCKDYDCEKSYRYKKLANNDSLLHLIYDYFTGQLQLDYEINEDEVKHKIVSAIIELTEE